MQGPSITAAFDSALCNVLCYFFTGDSQLSGDADRASAAYADKFDAEKKF